LAARALKASLFSRLGQRGSTGFLRAALLITTPSNSLFSLRSSFSPVAK
jgi:hypothetical protein